MMVKMILSPDKFGHYEIYNGRHREICTYSKFEAFERAKDRDVEIRWNFNEDVYDLIDWKQEPDIDLWSMYKLRARQIREAYDYVVLWYSGGSDSHNLLLAWIDAGLKIDEIATTWNYEATGDKQNHQNAEITNVVLPDIQKLKDSGFDFKFRLVDISPLCLDLFTYWKSEFEYNVNFHMSPNNPAKHLIRERVEDYKNLIASGKKVAFVWGKEKPRVKTFEGKHYFQFIDSIDNCVGPYVQRRYSQGWYDELFYWSPDFPLIPVKQAHIVKNYMKISGVPDDEMMKKLIYPKWSSSIFCNGKASSFTYSMRDEWFLKGNVDRLHNFHSVTNYYYDLVNPNDKVRKSLHPFFSKRYWLE